MNSTIAAKPRIIYNDDTCTLRIVPQPHSLDSLGHVLDYLKGTQVDCLCWCFGEQIAYAWPSKVMENFYDMHARGVELTTGWQQSGNVMMSLHEQGIDYVPALIERAKAQGLTFVASFRMNDTHLKSYPNSILAPEFWKEHQEYRIWESTDGKNYFNAALDYSYPEVRNRYRDAIEEVATWYDVDGIELDFTRTPYLFNPSEAWDKRDIATVFVRDIRDMLSEIGQQRGRPFTLIIRFNCIEHVLRTGGVDAHQWINEKLGDIFIASQHINNFNQDIQPWVDLCNEAGVLLYPAVELDPATNRTEFFSALPRNPAIPRHDGAVNYTPEERVIVQRAAAQNFLAQEPSGIAMFNFPCTLVEGPNHMHKAPGTFEHMVTVLSEMGSLETLAGKDKLFPFYGDLPIQLEAARPRRFHQTVDFNVRGGDVKDADVTLRFRQIAEPNPHYDGGAEHSYFVQPGVIKYYLNDREICEGEFARTRAEAGRIRSGFTLEEHEVIKVRLPRGELISGLNKLSFEMPHFPQESDPYVYIYELEVELKF